jgi:hypothetical protein
MSEPNKSPEMDKLAVHFLATSAKVALYNGFFGELPYTLRVMYNELLDNFVAGLPSEMRVDQKFVDAWFEQVVRPCEVAAREASDRLLTMAVEGNTEGFLEGMSDAPVDKGKLN